MKLIRAIRKSMMSSGLLEDMDNLLVAVSGGADSMALLTALHELRQELAVGLSVVHLNHRLRDAADEDEAQVRHMAESLGLRFFSARKNVAALDARQGLSIEMAAREARYALFESVARRELRGRVAVATAHTAGDQAETILLKLVRGAGARGLSGIPSVRDHGIIRLIRPMLDVSRRDVLAYLQARGVVWREDATNADPAFLRNRVRAELLPLLRERFNPAIQDALTRAATILGDEDAWLASLSAEILGDCRERLPSGSDRLLIDRLSIVPAAARRRVLRQWLVAGGVDGETLTFEGIEAIDHLVLRPRGSGRAAGAGWAVERRYNGLHLLTSCDDAGVEAFRGRLALRGETLVSAAGIRAWAGCGNSIIRDRSSCPGALPAAASLDRAAIGRKALFVRSWRPGDRMQPLGQSGSQKLQDIFVNSKIPRRQRGRIPIVECAGEIIWLPGYRVARGWEVKAEGRPTLELRLSEI